jgi:predicted transcriptional regulator
MSPEPPLSRRERQIMDALFRRGKATVAEVLADLPDPPSYSAVRALLRILEEKGHATHRKEGRGYVYSPTQPRQTAARSALTQVVRTFFEGSVEQAVAALVSGVDAQLSREELDRLALLIEQAKREGR